MDVITEGTPTDYWREMAKWYPHFVVNEYIYRYEEDVHLCNIEYLVIDIMIYRVDYFKL